ncbi:MAG: hypothetical protein Q8933_18260 [Bacteroidota bacterium]|nr:hypothetical protein [Bacteroidota bacterium]MDP4197134.1 hypothetical protein [Bacteroidota bacterium]
MYKTAPAIINIKAWNFYFSWFYSDGGSERNKRKRTKDIMVLYLSSYEYQEFEVPRRILNYQKGKINNRNVLSVEIDEPVIGQEYGFGGIDIYTLYLVNRFDENAFDNFDSFPIDVHVFIPKSPKDHVPTSLSDMQNIAWACLYDNEEDAKTHRVI